MTTLASALPASSIASGTMVTADGRTLPLQRTRLVVRAGAGFAAVRLLQTFANPFPEPLRVTYQLPLPADAAVGGFVFTIGDQRVVGDIDSRQRARARFERAMASGQTAGLIEQDRSSLFTQVIGNVPPGGVIEAEIDVDQPLQFADGEWVWRFPTTVAPRYLGAAGDIVDANRLQVDVVDPNGATLPPRLELALTIADLVAGGLPRSGSHALRCDAVAAGTAVAFAAPGGLVMMDRDVVVHWPAAQQQVGASLRTVHLQQGALAGRTFGLLTLVPPAPHVAAPTRPRDLIVLLDISGSMDGAPLEQAKAITSALIRSLLPTDRLELIAFASRPQPWRSGPQVADESNKAAALGWLAGLSASGGTEMQAAILAALAATRSGAQRQVVLVTDGHIGAEARIVGAIHTQLPSGSRVHVVGVGSAPNRSLTFGAARAGRGLELLLGLADDPQPFAAKLLARTQALLLDDLQIGGAGVRERAARVLPDLFANAPVRVLLELAPGGGAVEVRGAMPGGAFVTTLAVPAEHGGDLAIARAFGRERVEDLEAELAAGHGGAMAQIETVGLQFRISTRCTSWIAVAEQPTVDPRLPVRDELVPQELPHGMSVNQLGLRRCAPVGSFAASEVSGELADDECTKTMAPAPMSTLPAAAPRKAADGVRAEGRAQSRGDVPPKKSKNEERASGAEREGPAGAGFFDRLLGRSRRRDDAGGPARVARLVLQDATTLVFELAGFTDWLVPTKVVVTLADGRSVELAVDVARTTAAGRVRPRARLRLVLVGLEVAGVNGSKPVLLRWQHGAATLTATVA